MSSPITKGSPQCPGCGGSGRKVGLVTLGALLRPHAQERIGPGPYRFCSSRRCETVYYPEAGGSSFSRSDLSVRVGLKETEAPRPLCYCFDHTAEDLEAEIRRTGRSTLAERIMASLQNGCWCETKNPQGSCCLGVVHHDAREALEHVSRHDSAAAALEEADCCGSGCVPSERPTTRGR
jgi:CopZ-like zinc binding protein